MTRFLIALAALILAAFPATAQHDERHDTILVLDASGSMWGQIDGINKIVIAREVIADVLADLPEELDLGLMAYGHNRRGDCSDIEMLIEPGPGTRGAIVDAVNSINPRGRTPMTDAVVAAAQALRYTENQATVILVSDGIETCDADPCALAAELEAAGIGFTAHVIGFDVASEPEARAQMQCLAENTGGQFLTADNAEELSAALTAVVAPPAPPPANVTVTAVVEPGGAAPVSPLVWTLRNAAGEAVIGPVTAPGFIADLPAGDYAVEVLRQAQGTSHGAAFTVAAGESREIVVPLPALLTAVTFEARLDTADGPLITDPVEWAFASPEGTDHVGNPLTAEFLPGSYEIEAYWTVAEQERATQISVLGGQDRTVVLVFETPLPTATLVAPAEAVAGSTLEVAWQGPNATADFIATARRGEGVYATNVRVDTGNPVALRVPSQPGDYDLRYYLADGRVVLAEQPLTVTPAIASLQAPETAVAGATIEVAWTGPAYRPDFIAVAEPGSNSHINHTLTREGSPLELVMPVEPGTYEIRYSMQQDREIIATRMIEVTEIGATLIAPDSAPAGSEIEVSWEGPDYQNDFIAISEADDDRGYVNTTYTREGSPLTLTMPVEPGSYEIRYITAQDRQILGRRAIEVTPVTAGITAPDSAEAGSTVEVAWTGPGYERDFIGVGPADEDNRYLNYTYTREGSPLELVMPVEPGSYEIRYYVNQDRTVIASHAIEITAIAAAITAPGSAEAGSTIEVAWTGPDYDRDFVAIGPVGEDRYINYVYTRNGTPIDLLMPAEPGDYEIRYYVNQDRSVIAAVPITITSVAAGLQAPDSAVAGSTIEVAWTGPDYDRDFIAVSAVGVDNRYENYTYTRDGSPLELVMPTSPGDYEIRYYVDQDRTVLAVRPITVTSVSAALQAPANAVVGDTIEVAWQGPDYARDFVAVAEIDVDNRYLNYGYTRDGSPVELVMPSQPGNYEIRYYMDQDRVVLARVVVAVAELPPVTLDAPSRVAAGSNLLIRHTGPDYPRDFVAFGTPGDDRRYETYAYTRDGNPLEIRVPDMPGTYELRYYMDQDRRIVSRREIMVE